MNIFSSFRGDSSDKILFGFLAVCCLCFIGIAFGFYIGNEELTETIETFMRIISHKETMVIKITNKEAYSRHIYLGLQINTIFWNTSPLLDLY